MNVDLLIAKLINNEMATLHQLKTVYSLKDARYLNEVLDLRLERIYLENKELEKKSRP